jgi:predicted enzyme related to lactoylglutathione lyase
MTLMHAHLGMVSVPVSDQQRAKKFYSEVLEFAVLNDAPFRPDARWIEMAPNGEGRLSISLVNWFDTMPPGSLKGLVLMSDDLDTAWQTLTTRGCKPTAIQAAPWGRYTTFSDPDGNGWVLQESPRGLKARGWIDTDRNRIPISARPSVARVVAKKPRGWSGIVDCEVTELDPPRRLAYTWKSGNVDLELVHSGFKGTSQTILRKFMMGPGWSRMLESKIPEILARITAQGFVPATRE